MVSSRTPRLRSAAVVTGLAAALTGCGGRAAPPETSASPAVNPCYVAAAGAPRRDTVVVAIARPDAERFLAAHLIAWRQALDCLGRSVPLASAPFRAVSDNPVVLAPSPAERPGPSIRLQAFDPAGDARDLIDGGADVVITADPAALEYARGRGGLRLVPLAWSTTYILVSPPGSPLLIDASAALRTELARDVVLAEARPVELPFWWDGATRCTARARDSTGRLPHIGFPAGDRVAQALAERLIAIAPEPPTGPRRLLSLGPSAFNYGLSLGSMEAYVAPLPSHRPLLDCEGIPPVPAQSIVAPLVETRATAVLRPGVPPFLVLGDGTIRFLSPGRQ